MSHKNSEPESDIKIVFVIRHSCNHFANKQ